MFVRLNCSRAIYTSTLNNGTSGRNLAGWLVQVEDTFKVSIDIRGESALDIPYDSVFPSTSQRRCQSPTDRKGTLFGQRDQSDFLSPRHNSHPEH
jgi:hypothetical protein